MAPSITLLKKPRLDNQPPLHTAAQQSSHQKAPKQKEPATVSETPETDNLLQHMTSLPLDSVNSKIEEILHNNNIFPEELDIASEIGKIYKDKIGLMWPTSFAKEHEAAPLLDAYSTHGCPVECGEKWTVEMVETALRKGNHSSANTPAARQYLLQEIKKKVADGYQKVVKWKDIKNNLPENIKLSPIACIEHKSRAFRVILDLSYRLLFKGSRIPSVNEATNLQSPQKAMAELGNVLRRIIHILCENFNVELPFKFAKVDIKDGFWRLAVSEDDAWHFCYSVPPASKDEPLDERSIVVPTALAMGWAESPSFFCTATETGRDVIERLFNSNMDNLPSHPSEHLMLDTSAPPAPQVHNDIKRKLLQFIEVYVDDFIAGTNNLEVEHLRQLSRAILHGVNSIFPDTDTSNHTGEDPISQKKMLEGDGLWAHEKEVLGWIFNGLDFTIFLPPQKTAKLRKLLKTTAKQKASPLKQFQSIAGKMNHATIGIPNGKALCSALYAATKGDPEHVIITPMVKQSLNDWNILLNQISTRPTHVLELIPNPPCFIGFVDACKFGIGGVWLSGTDSITPHVWRLELPPAIQDQLVSDKNPKGSLTINDLEMAGILLQWLVLEHISPITLQHRNPLIFCDNTSAVAWTHKFSTTTSTVAAHLLMALALRQHVHRSSPLLVASIAGVDNDIADVPSRSFHDSTFTNSQKTFCQSFSNMFPLKQNHSWKEYRLPKRLSSRVTSLLLGKQSTLASWTQIPKQGKNTGSIGETMQPRLTKRTPTSETKQTFKNVLSLQHLQQEYGLDITVKDDVLKSILSSKQSAPSPRQSSWLENAPQSIRHQRHTPRQWHGQWKVGGETIRPQWPNLQSR